MKVVVGAGGFIGSAVAEYFTANYTGSLLGLDHGQLDLLDPQQLAGPFSKIEEPFNIIYCAGISRSEADDSKSSELNIKMLQNLTNSLAGTKIQKITFLSSVEIYGNTPGLPLDENSPARPERKYAEAKLQQEELLRTFCQQQNCQLSLLRLPGVYGRSEKKLGFINQLTDRLQNGGNYQIYQGGGERRDFLHILDLVQVIFLLEDKEIPEQLLNIATGESYSTLQWKDWLCQKLAVSGSAIEILPATKELGHLEFDTSKLRELLPEFKFSLPQDVLGL